MPSKIILKKSSVAAKAPVAGDLDFGELAINYTDSKLYFKKADGSIDAFSSAAASAPVTSVGGNIGAITDAQLLASIKNVDGTGSGLDADFLDGNSAAAFYLATNPNGYTSNAGTVTSVGATAPIVSSGGTTPSLSIAAANSTTNGYMTSAYASKLDGIAAGAQVNVATNLAQGTRTTTAVPITSSTGTTATLDIATTLLAGVMSSADKTKLDGIATGATANTGTVTSVGATAPVASSGGTAPVISMAAATSVANGYMTSTYAAKLDGIAAGATANTGTVTGVTATAPVASSGGTAPVISMAAASSGVNGYMTGTYATKLDGIAAGATNVTNTNQLTNGAGYITSSGSITGNAATATTANALNASNAYTGTGFTASTASAYIVSNRTSSSSGQVGYNWAQGGTNIWWNYLDTSNTTLTWYNSIGTTNVMTLTTGGALNTTGAITQNGSQVLTAGNYNSYAPTLTGGGASGTWGINITGNAATATSATNATTAGGLSVHAGRNNEANKIVRTDGNGYIQAGWINTDSGDNGTNAIDRVYASGDGYIRYYSPTNFRTVLNVPTRTGGNASGTWGINVTGNAATITSQANSATITASTAATANQIVLRDSVGDTYCRYSFASYQNSSDDVNTGAISHIMAKFGDNYHRSATAAKVATFISGQTMNINGSSTSCTGNAATASNGGVTSVNGATGAVTVASGQYFGTAATKAIAYNANTIGENVTVTAGNNGLSAGPITISSGFTVTVQSGSVWTVV